MRVRMTVVAAAVALLLCGIFTSPAALEGQGPEGRWPLQPKSSLDRVIAPFLEGWYANDDGTYTLSFGYVNMNDEAVEIPLGEGNLMEPAQFDGRQPTTFSPGRHRGVDLNLVLQADLHRERLPVIPCIVCGVRTGANAPGTQKGRR